MQHHGLDCDSWSECHHDSPFRCLAFLLVGRPNLTAAQLIEHADHRCAAHVAELAENVATGRKLPVVRPSTPPMWSRMARPPGWIVVQVLGPGVTNKDVYSAQLLCEVSGPILLQLSWFHLLPARCGN